jgi:hypothetical protein
VRRIAYGRYINSPAWRARRRRFLDRYGEHCRACGSTDRVQVHHKTYDHLGAELDEELVALCEACHSNVHKLERDLGITLALATGAIVSPPPARDFVSLNPRPGYVAQHLGGREGRLSGLSVIGRDRITGLARDR